MKGRHIFSSIFLVASISMPVAIAAPPATADDGALTELVVPERHRSGDFLTRRKLTAPAGFTVAVWASGLGKVRMLAEDQKGAIYASVPSAGKVLKLSDSGGKGHADDIRVYAEGLDRPHGIAFLDKSMVVAETGALVVLKDDDGDGRADSRKVISTDIPEGGGHWTRTVAIGPDGNLYVSAGSSCNVCVEKDRRRAAIMRFEPEGGKGELFAIGLRNSVGIAFDPRTGDLWAVDNGSDWRGENKPPEELNRIVKGGDYGWPYCFGDREPDPDYKDAARCGSTVMPEVKMQAHSAPLGLAFGYGLDFPSPFREMLFISFHGSWNRLVPTGYKVVAVPFKDGRPSGKPIDFITGWMAEDSVWGRPVGLLASRDGSLYLSDDYAGAIYRITAQKGGKE